MILRYINSLTFILNINCCTSKRDQYAGYRCAMVDDIVTRHIPVQAQS